jgi:hypothetical protein
VLRGRELQGFVRILAASACILLVVQGGFPFPGLGGGDLTNPVGDETGVPLLWPLAGWILLGLGSARHAYLHHRRRAELAVWISSDMRRAA